MTGHDLRVALATGGITPPCDRSGGLGTVAVGGPDVEDRGRAEARACRVWLSGLGERGAALTATIAQRFAAIAGHKL